MANEKNSHKVYAEEVKAKSGKDYYRTQTVDLQEIMDNVGRYVSVSLFMNEREVNGEVKKSSTLMINESDAKYLPKKKDAESASAGAASSSQPAGGSRTGVRRV